MSSLPTGPVSLPDPSAVASTVSVTPMRRRHLRSVLRIEHQAVHKGWSLGLFMSELARDEGRVYLVAKVGSTVVGFVGLLFAGTDGHITTISVDPGWQGRQVGTRLMLVVTRQAVESGAEALTLEVRADNAPAIALYRRFGFSPAGVRKNYYAELGEDALIMWATDIQSTEYAARLDGLDASLPGATIIQTKVR